MTRSDFEVLGIAVFFIVFNILLVYAAYAK
jgi:hypothetical protein